MEDHDLQRNSTRTTSNNQNALLKCVLSGLLMNHINTTFSNQVNNNVSTNYLDKTNSHYQQCKCEYEDMKLLELINDER